MSRIDDLIEQYTPGGVEYKQLGEVGTFVRGNGLQKKDLLGNGVPAIHYGQIHTVYGAWTRETISYVTADFAAHLRKAEPGNLVIATTSEDDEAVAKATAWLGEVNAAVSGDAYIYRHTLEPKYLAYFFQSEEFQNQKKVGITGTKVRRISGGSLAKIRIPVPPFEVQREIVKILDAFAELEAELEARRRQYAHYRDALLGFRDAGRARWTPMGELGTFIRGRRFTKDDMVDAGIPSIHYGEIYTHYGVRATETLSHVREQIAGSLRFAKPGDVVIASVGETVEDVAKAVAWLGDTDVAIHDDSFAFRSDADPTYIAYVMQTAAFHVQKEKYVARGKVKRVGGANLGKIVVPVPSLDEQQRIVRILNTFDTLVNDLSSGLPAEIEARRHQYAYYRDRLFTFEEAPA